MSKAPIQDWELTAYSIDELDARHRASIQARLMDQPELREDFYALQELGSLLEEGFEQEMQPFLTGEQRARILRGDDRRRRRGQLLQATFAASALGLAACLALGFVKLQIALPPSSVERTAAAAVQEALLDTRALQISGEEAFLQRILTLELGVGAQGVTSPVGAENAAVFSAGNVAPQSF